MSQTQDQSEKAQPNGHERTDAPALLPFAFPLSKCDWPYKHHRSCKGALAFCNWPVVRLTIFTRAPATAALAALGVWLLFALFWSVLTPLVATLIAGPPEGIFGPNIAYLQTSQVLDRISPNTLYAEIALALLQPATRALGPVFYSQVQGALLGAPLPASQSFILVWPQLTGLIAAMILSIQIDRLRTRRRI